MRYFRSRNQGHQQTFHAYSSRHASWGSFIRQRAPELFFVTIVFLILACVMAFTVVERDVTETRVETNVVNFPPPKFRGPEHSFVPRKQNPAKNRPNFKSAEYLSHIHSIADTDTEDSMSPKQRAKYASPNLGFADQSSPNNDSLKEEDDTPGTQTRKNPAFGDTPKTTALKTIKIDVSKSSKSVKPQTKHIKLSPNITHNESGVTNATKNASSKPKPNAWKLPTTRKSVSSAVDEETLADFRRKNFFCPVHDKKYDAFLRDFYNLQYPRHEQCKIKEDRKYLIYRWKCFWGLVAQVKSMWIHSLMVALYLNRTFMFTDERLWGWAPREECGNSSYNCYFQPVSTCTESMIYQNTLKDERRKGNISKYTIWQTRPNINESTLEEMDKYDVIIANMCSRDTIKPQVFEKFLMERWNITWSEWLSVVTSWFLAPNEHMKAAINRVVNGSLATMIDNVPHNPKQVPSLLTSEKPLFRMENTISMPIRWGDKCYQRQELMRKKEGTDFFIKPEISCPTFQQYMYIAESIRKIHPNVDTIILTSESKEIISAMYNYFYLNNTQSIQFSDSADMDSNPATDANSQFASDENDTITQQTRSDTGQLQYSKWKFVINKYDIMPGIGIINRYDDIHSGKNESKLNYFDALVSQLSTFKLQMYAKYYITLLSSKWIDSMWNLAYSLQCLPSYESLHISKETYGKHVQIAKNRSCVNVVEHKNRENPKIASIGLEWGEEFVNHPNISLLIHEPSKNLFVTHDFSKTCDRWINPMRSYNY